MMLRWPVVQIVILLWCCLGSSAAWASASPTLTARVYKKIIESQAALTDKKLDTSQQVLEAIADGADNSPYDNAMIWHLLGYVYYEQGDLKKAARTYEKVFEYDIPASLALSTHKMLGQVYLAMGDAQAALPHLRHWLEGETKDRESVHALIAHCHYELKQYKSAVTHLETAIEGYRARLLTPKESWLNLLQASLAQMDDIEHRIDTLKLLLAWFPKTEYWLALASAYAQLEKMDKYLAILALAHRKDLLTGESQYLSLASVYFAEGAPHNASQVLEQGFDRKLIKPTVRNLRFLASAYGMAREHEKALVPLTQAAAQSQDGEIDILLGNALFQLARWQAAADALAKGLEKGDLKQATTARLMLGQTLLNLKQYDAAIAAFVTAAEDTERTKQAEQWLEYARYEKARQEQRQQEANDS